MRTSIVNTILLGSLVASWALGGCSSAETPASSESAETSGTVGLELQLGAGIAIDSVSYTVVGPNSFSKTGTINVKDSSKVSAIISGLPFGAGYALTLTGKTTDGQGTCGGSASFDIDSATTKEVTVHLTCDIQPKNGSILVNGSVNACPRIDGIDASPAEVAVNGSIALQGAAVDVDNAPSALSYSWSASSGVISDVAGATAKFTCTKVGKATITLGAADGDTACNSHQTVDVSCSDPLTVSPIKHVIVLIGENRTFDHVYGTYLPRPGQTVSNLLSKGIINADGTPGPNYQKAIQASAAPEASYYIGADSKTPYAVLPPPTTGGTPSAPQAAAAPFISIEVPKAVITDLDPSDLILTTTGASGLPAKVTDTRIANAANLPGGPFQMTGPSMPYDAYTGDTTHRFYQMWQQSDCSVTNATAENPAGCLSDLYPFVITSFSTANNGVGNSMAFFNVQNGDAPLFKQWADKYAMSDNFHQSFQGGTGANHSMIGFGDAVAWTDGNGHPAVPPANMIANPNPKANTNNNYTIDGNFSDCSNTTAPGVGPIVGYLGTLPHRPSPNCEASTYYYLNNTNPAYQTNGTLSTTGTFVPPTKQRSIGDTLRDANVSWRFYGGLYNRSLQNLSGYCAICNPFQYQTSVMADAAERSEHIKDTVDMFTDIAMNTLPAVSFAHPDGVLDGHPQSSKLGLYEAYVKNILNKLHANPQLEASTLVIVTFDEGGGYYDSGFIQPIDFFGDGPRIPMIAISPYSTGGKISHNYADHTSILKFIERNWTLNPITNRSRDNLPNPIAAASDPYVPTNQPAVDDLFDLFDFSHSGS
jgi:phospholipase C